MYILSAMDYISKWIYDIPTKTNDTKAVMKFLMENIFTIFGMPRAIISDQGTNFTNRSFDALLRRYSIFYRIATPYHPQTNSQVEVSNW